MCEFEDEMSDRYPGDVIHKIIRCFRELIKNAVVHGNKNDETLETCIKAQFCKETIKLCVRDSGEGFNWHDMDFSSNTFTVKNKVRGLVFVSACSQSLEFNDKGNEVRCILSVT
jgi:serine/threonine-protein kinase RsbW